MKLGLELINGALKSESEKYREVLICVNSFVHRLEQHVSEHGFVDDAEEIDFFKRVYPKFQSWFTFYAELSPILRNVPRNAPDVILRDYYIQEFNYLCRFLIRTGWFMIITQSVWWIGMRVISWSAILCLFCLWLGTFRWIGVF